MNTQTFTVQMPADGPRLLDFPADKDLVQTLSNWAHTYDLVWLLAISLDGIIWGQYKDSALTLSTTPFPQLSPPLAYDTLQSARLFGNRAEITIWCTGQQLKACLLQEDDPNADQLQPMLYYNDTHLLWGSEIATAKNGFTQLIEGERGLPHALPMTVTQNQLRLHLALRHYINYTPTGQAYVQYSRLVGLR